MAGTDWEAIEAEYRSGSLSVNEIARQAEITPAAVRNRAKRYGWVRDLSAQVQSATRAKLLTDVTPDVTPSRAGEIIEAAAARAADVVRLHRQDLAELRAREKRLLEMFDALAPIAVTPKEAAMLGGLLTDAAGVIGKVIPLERQAFNLDASETKSDDPSEVAAAAARKVLGSLASIRDAGASSRDSGEPNS